MTAKNPNATKELFGGPQWIVIPAARFGFLAGNLGPEAMIDAMGASECLLVVSKGADGIHEVVGAAMRRWSCVDLLVSWWDRGGAVRQLVPWFERHCPGTLMVKLNRGLLCKLGDFAAAVRERWGDRSVFEASAHSNVAVISGPDAGPDGGAVVTSSAGSADPRLEWTMVDRRPAVVDFWRGWFGGRS